MVRFVVGWLPPTNVASAVREGCVVRERQHDEPAPDNQSNSERQLSISASTTVGK